MNADLHARTSWWRLQGAAARVSDLADGNGRVSEVQFAVLNLEVVLGGRNVLVYANLRLGCSMVLDLYLEIERCNPVESDRNDFFTLSLACTPAVCLAGLVESCAWSWMDSLLHQDRQEVLA